MHHGNASFLKILTILNIFAGAATTFVLFGLINMFGVDDDMDSARIQLPPPQSAQ